MEIIGSLSAARRETDARLSSLRSGGSSDLMTKWFFSNSKEDREIIQNKLSKLSGNLHKTNLRTILPSNACMPGCQKGATNPNTGAFIFGDDGNIYLNDEAFNKNYWSLDRIFIHEASHLFNIGSRDIEYGILKSLNLINDPPALRVRRAKNNADSISYFVTGGRN